METIDHLIVSAPSHLHSKQDVPTAMGDVIISLIPAFLAATIFFGLNAIFLIFVCVSSACLSEALVRRIFKKPITLWDKSAIVTGILLAFTLPPTTPWWLAIIGTFIAIVIAKELFGGLGRNIFNPALFGRVFIFLLPQWKVLLDNYVKPLWWLESSFFSLITVKMENASVFVLTMAAKHIDGLTGATPLMLQKAGSILNSRNINYLNLFLGNIRGSLGETSAIALLIGAVYLFYKGHINWEIPGTIIGTVIVISIIWSQDPIFHILSGGLILGAFFMATDWVTSPITSKGQIIYGISIGIFIMMTRRFGIKPEGVALAILHLNLLALFIDRFTLPKKFGG